MTNAAKLRERVEAAAERLGASRSAVLKWRARGIPSEWRIRLLSDEHTRFRLADFELVDSIGTSARDREGADAS
jgi:hypothetical protein